MIRIRTKTVREKMDILPADKVLDEIEAKHEWQPYEGWAPYCLMCSTMLRMKKRHYGWHCDACGNDINHDCYHVAPGSDFNTNVSIHTPQKKSN